MPHETREPEAMEALLSDSVVMSGLCCNSVVVRSDEAYI